MIELTCIVLFITLIFLFILIIKRNSRDPILAVVALKDMDIRIVNTENECLLTIIEIKRRCQYYQSVGFDCEWVTHGKTRQPVSLLQISTHDGLCALFRLNLIKHFPLEFLEFLKDETIYKVGVTPLNDANYLYQDYSLQVSSTLDIRHIVSLCGYKTGGLAMLSESLLGITLDKTFWVRCSDWDDDYLTPRQCFYAAADAHVAIKMLVKLVEEYNSKNTPWFTSPKKNCWERIDNLLWAYADINYKQPSFNNSNKQKSNNVSLESAMPRKKYTNSTRSKPLYHNSIMLAPDGDMLCTCDTKKATWYVDKGLADFVSKDPLTVKLRFEPSGRAVGVVGEFYRQAKQNICVVCGSDSSYIRKNVVPREYRKFFPDIMKEHSSHDVLLLCSKCHQISNMRNQVIKDKLAVLCDAPLLSGANTMYSEDEDCKKLRSAARALLVDSTKHNLPPYRKEELENIVLQNYPEETVFGDQLLIKATQVQVLLRIRLLEGRLTKLEEALLHSEGTEQYEDLALNGVRRRRLLN